MEKKIIVFDFDKTLINYDSSYSFFKFCAKRKLSTYLLFPFYFFFKVLSKLNFISVKKEKDYSLLFYCPKGLNQFEKICEDFSKTLALNNIYNEFFLKYSNDNQYHVIISSASFECYLKYIFPDNHVLGTTLKINTLNKIISINNHPFRKEKAELLKGEGVKLIDEFFTDSENDIPTSLMAKKTYWVKNGGIIKVIQ